MSSRRGRYVLLSGQSFLRTPRRHPEISGSRRKPVVDSTFMKQFSRKLREIETHSDYGNIEIVVRQGTRLGLKRKTALVGKKCPKFEIHYGVAAFEASSVIIYI